MSLLLHQFCMNLLSKRGESKQKDGNKVSYKALYEAPLTRKTRLELAFVSWMRSTEISFFPKDFLGRDISKLTKH
jgi:hypothetical protein